MTGDTADTTATAANALAAAAVETAGKCVLLWPSAAFTAVQGARRSAALPAVLILNAN